MTLMVAQQINNGTTMETNKNKDIEILKKIIDDAPKKFPISIEKGDHQKNLTIMDVIINIITKFLDSDDKEIPKKICDLIDYFRGSIANHDLAIIEKRDSDDFYLLTFGSAHFLTMLCDILHDDEVLYYFFLREKCMREIEKRFNINVFNFDVIVERLKKL